MERGGTRIAEGNSSALLVGLALLAAAVGVVALATPGPAPFAQTLYVDDDGGCGGNAPCFPTIGEAMDAAADGDTVLVYGGTYGPSFVDRSVLLAGEDPLLVLIDGMRQEGLRVTAPNAVVHNVTVANATDGIVVQGGGVRLSNTIARGNSGYGIVAAQTDGILIAGATVTTNNQGGILLSDVRYGSVADSRIANNNANGIDVRGGIGVLLVDNVIEVNMGWGIEAFQAQNVVSSGNRVSSNGPPPVPAGARTPGPATHSTGGGIKYWEVDPSAVEQNEILQNLGEGVQLLDSVDILVRENDVVGNEVGIGLNGTATSLVYRNNFAQNGRPVESVDTDRVDFDDGSGHGNYWDDYAGLDDGSGVGRLGEARAAGDGIGDTDVPHQGVDWYPFMVRDGWLSVGADIVVKPENLNLRANGRFTVFIELADGSDPAGIRLDTVRLSTGKGTAEALTEPSPVVDRDGDGVQERMVKFDRTAVHDLLDAGDITINVGGELEDGRAFFGTVTVHIIGPP